MRPASPFTEIAAVRAWDAWFRWRDTAGLRDRTIEATWWRVARDIARVEGTQAESWGRRYFEVFSRWQLLPDERLVRSAGTGMPIAPEGVLRASINARAFVGPHGLDIDYNGIVDTACLAVRLLDAAQRAPDSPFPADAGLRIGLLGVADALAALGLAYDSDAGLAAAAEIAAALARGARLGADERGRSDARLTGIVPQPRLAQLANLASDAVDPPVPERDRLRPPEVSCEARLRMRAAVQPWIDDPIDYLSPIDAPTDAALSSTVMPG